MNTFLIHINPHEQAHIMAPVDAAMVEYHIGDYARATIIYDQRDAHHGGPVKYTISVGRGAQVDYRIIALHGANLEHTYDLILGGSGAHIQLRALYILNHDQQVAITTRQVHEAPDTSSSVLLKGILQGKGQATHRGTIFVHEGAHGTNASQHSKHLMLSDQARAWTMPSLEVLAHQVRCAHGSAIGTLDEEQLFYMQARGMSYVAARRILVEGFCADVVSIPADAGDYGRRIRDAI